MGKVVRVYTGSLNVDGYGDFVKCLDCGTLMLMQIGGTACGMCESKNLEWVNDDGQECNIEELEQMGYIIEEV